MAARRHYCSPWADIQPEILGLVRRRLPSLADRVRPGAVCRAWRRSARVEPVPPPFPWLTLHEGTFLSVPGGEVHCIPAAPPGNSRCHCSVGCRLFLQHLYLTGDGECSSSLSLTDPSSNDVLPLPDVDTIWGCHEPVDGYPRHPSLYKLVALSPMDLSPDTLLAAFITDNTCQSVISIFQSSAAAAAAFRVPDPDREGIFDVALVGGKLYAFSPLKLFVLDVDSSRRAGEPRIPSMEIAGAVDLPWILWKTIAGESYTCAYWTYLVESSGKLWLVRRLIGRLSDLPQEDWMECSRTFTFEVLEADLSSNGSCVQ